MKYVINIANLDWNDQTEEWEAGQHLDTHVEEADSLEEAYLEQQYSLRDWLEDVPPEQRGEGVWFEVTADDDSADDDSADDDSPIIVGYVTADLRMFRRRHVH
jgi:hypothetical protein